MEKNKKLSQAMVFILLFGIVSLFSDMTHEGASSIRGAYLSLLGASAIYIVSRAAGKIGGACLGGKITKAEPTVTKYLGFTLLPHSGVSLVFTGIAVTTLTDIDTSLASVISGTIVAAAIINEIIAVIIAKYAFKWAGEIKE